MAASDWVPLVDVRVVGDETWTIHAISQAVIDGDEECDWDDPHMEVRYGPSKRYGLIASDHDTDAPGTVDLSGCDFANGVLLALITGTEATSVRSCHQSYVYAELSVDSAAMGGRRTVGRFKIPVVDEVTVEP